MACVTVCRVNGTGCCTSTISATEAAGSATNNHNVINRQTRYQRFAMNDCKIASFTLYSRLKNGNRQYLSNEGEIRTEAAGLQVTDGYHFRRGHSQNQSG